MAIRPSERDLILGSDKHKEYHPAVEEARKFSEGYNIQYEVVDKDTYSFIKKFIKLIIAQR